MTSETTKKRKIHKPKGHTGGDSDDYEFGEHPKDGSTCLYALYVMALVGGIFVLLALVNVHHKAVVVSSPRLEDWPAGVRPPGVQQGSHVHTVYRTMQPQPPPPPGQQQQQGEAPLGADGAASGDVGNIDGESASRNPSDPVAESPEQLSVAPNPSDRVQQPLEYVPLPIEDVRLEGSEPQVEGAPGQGPGGQPIMGEKQEVRVRQVIQKQIHPDGSVTEKVVAEYVLKPGDEGYDDLGKEPVVISHGTVSPNYDPTKVTASESTAPA